MSFEKELEKLLDEILQGQKEKLLACGRSFIPTLTPEDLLQPCDYPILEQNPHFRYEEGVIEGLMTAKMAILALISHRGNG
jgi:hypothetical protein